MKTFNRNHSEKRIGIVDCPEDSIQRGRVSFPSNRMVIGSTGSSRLPDVFSSVKDEFLI